MQLSWLAVAALIVCAAWKAPDAAAADLGERRLKLSLGYHYSTGTYETSDTTVIHYVPLTTKADWGRWSIQGTLPYLRISGPAGFAEGPAGPIQTTSGEADGLGDILLRGVYALSPLTSWMPPVDLVGVVKLPTASRSDGLGTGEFDFGFEADFWWAFGDFVPFGTVGCRYLGSPPETDLDTVFIGSLGGLYRFAETVSAGLLLDYRPSPAATIGQRLELIPFVSWRVTDHWSADLYVSAGLAEGSPDAGTGLQLGYTW
jgi:hypothetical protein